MLESPIHYEIMETSSKLKKIFKFKLKTDFTSVIEHSMILQQINEKSTPKDINTNPKYCSRRTGI